MNRRVRLTARLGPSTARLDTRVPPTRKQEAPEIAELLRVEATHEIPGPRKGGHLVSLERVAIFLRRERHGDAKNCNHEQPRVYEKTSDKQHMPKDKQRHRNDVDEQVGAVLVHGRRFSPRPR